ncbi:MAG: hypothetical protein LAO30_19870, partial [Acidobacteriia bacterium]|nr:hypothetical protein [Terriglobia bacterium]
NNLGLADSIIIAGFFVVMLCIGIYYAGQMRDLKTYFSGGRQVPWWLSGVSLYVSSFSAFTFVAYSELAYKYGMLAVTIWWLMVPCILISAQFFAARWRRTASTSPLEYIETRFGLSLRQGLAWLGVPLITIDDGLKLFALGTLVSVSFGFDLMLAIYLSAGVLLAYTFMGGLWAVLVTDFVQFVILLTAVIVLVPLALARVGGMQGFVDHLPHGFFRPVGGNYTWYYILAFVLVQVCAYSTKWSYVQRYYSVRSDSDARKVGYLVAFLTFVGPVIFFLPPMAARAFLPPVTDTKNVYALLCNVLLPSGMKGLLIAAMFSATMSALSGDFNAVAAVVTKDIYQRLFATNYSERSLVNVGRLATLLAGLIALGVAVSITLLGGRSDLFTYMASLFGILMPPMAIPMMFGLISRKISAAGGLSGFLAGSAAGLIAFILSFTLGASHLRDVTYMAWITTIPTLGAMFLVTHFRPNTPSQQERIQGFLSGLAPDGLDDARAATDEEAVSSPLRLIGLAVGSLGVLVVLAVLLFVPSGGRLVTLVVGSAMAGLGFVLSVGSHAHTQRRTGLRL